jgi:hypothetical protein
MIVKQFLELETWFFPNFSHRSGQGPGKNLTLSVAKPNHLPLVTCGLPR